MNIKISIGERIKNRRKELGLSVGDLAKKIGKNRATIYRYESSYIENMPTTVLEPIAKALNTTPAYLMGWVDEEIEKKNDILTDIVLKLQSDDNFREVVSSLYKLTPEQINAVKTFLMAFN